MVLQVQLVSKVLPERLVLQDLKVSKVQLEHKANKVLLVLKVQLVLALKFIKHTLP